jgi:hypothetical protein
MARLSTETPYLHPFGIRFWLLSLALTIMIGGNSVSLAQSPAPTATPTPLVDNTITQGSPSQTNANDVATEKQDDKAAAKKEKRGSLIVAPIPISSPAFGSGLLVITAYVFRLNQDDQISPPSWVGLAGVWTNNGSRALAAGSRLYLKENKYQTTFAFGKGTANLDFYGIGRIPGRQAIAVPLSMKGSFFFGEFMRNLGGNVFVGPRYQYRSITAGIDGVRPPGGFEIPAIDLKSNSAALGFHVQRDRRDSTFYPRKGSLIDFTGDFFDQTWGSRREYQTYKVAYNAYREIASKQILAYRAMACSANGSVPFYDLCLFGFNSDLRGYTTGEFQNRRMFAAQAEYRRELRKRFGAVAFGGVGGIARKWSEFRSDQLLPAAGVGIRFNLDKKNHINYRVDFSVGREGSTVSIGVGEAF